MAKRAELLFGHSSIKNYLTAEIGHVYKQRLLFIHFIACFIDSAQPCLMGSPAHDPYCTPVTCRTVFILTQFTVNSDMTFREEMANSHTVWKRHATVAPQNGGLLSAAISSPIRKQVTCRKPLARVPTSPHSPPSDI